MPANHDPIIVSAPAMAQTVAWCLRSAVSPLPRGAFEHSGELRAAAPVIIRVVHMAPDRLQTWRTFAPAQLESQRRHHVSRRQANPVQCRTADRVKV